MQADTLLAAWAALMLGSGGAAQAAPPEPQIVELQDRLAAEVARLKAQLSALETGADYASLLARKLTVDCSLAPLLLEEDAAAFVAAVAAGREPPDLLRLLRAEYGDAPQRSRWSCRDGPARAARALASWAAPTDGLAACSATSAALVAPDDESAPFICWTARIEGSAAAPAVRADACWYEPCLETRRLDWPLCPLNVELAWDDATGRIAMGSGVQHAEAWPAQPLFNNPPDLYAVFDTVRSRKCIDMSLLAEAPRDVAGARVSEPPDIVTRTLTRADGSTVRVESWRYESGRLVSLEITQPPLRLVHSSPQAYEIRRQVQGEPAAEPEDLAPQSVLAYPSTGMLIAVTFRAPDPTKDALDPERMSDPNATVPDEIRIATGARTCAHAIVAGLAAGRGDAGATRVERALRGWSLAAASSAAARVQAMSQAETACAAGDLPSVRAALAQTMRLIDADGVPAAWNTSNVEVCIRRLEEAGHLAEAAELASAEWLASLSNADPARRRHAASRAVLGGSPALEAVATEALAAQDDAARRAVDDALAERSQRQRTIGATLESCVPPCDEGSLSPEFAALQSAIRAAVATLPRTARPLGPGLAAALVRSSCKTLHDSVGTGEDLSAPMIASAAADVRALIQNGMGEFSPVVLADPASGCSVCAEFARRVARATRLIAPSEGERAALRHAVHSFAEATLTVARLVALERGMPAPEAEDVARRAAASVAALKGLAGNVFEPVLLRMPAAPVPDSLQLIAAVRGSMELKVALQGLDKELEVRAESHVNGPMESASDSPDALAIRPPKVDPRDRLRGRLAAAVASAGLGALHDWHGRGAVSPLATQAVTPTLPTGHAAPEN